MAAQRIKVDLSDDPMASLFEDDFVPSKPRAVAPVAAPAAEEPALVAMDLSKVALKGKALAAGSAVSGAAARVPDDRVIREDLHGDDVRMGLGVDFSSLAPAVPSGRLALDDGGVRNTADDVFGVAAPAAAGRTDDEKLLAALPESRGVAIARKTESEAKVEDLLVGKLLEREDFSGLETSNSLFGASAVKRVGHEAPEPLPKGADAPDLDDDLFADFDKATALDAPTSAAPRAPPRPAPAAPAAPVAKPVGDDFDFAKYISSAGGADGPTGGGGGLFD